MNRYNYSIEEVISILKTQLQRHNEVRITMDLFHPVFELLEGTNKEINDLRYEVKSTNATLQHQIKLSEEYLNSSKQNQELLDKIYKYCEDEIKNQECSINEIKKRKVLNNTIELYNRKAIKQNCENIQSLYPKKEKE